MGREDYQETCHKSEVILLPVSTILFFIIWNICIHFCHFGCHSPRRWLPDLRSYVGSGSAHCERPIKVIYAQEASFESKCGIHELGVSEFTLDETRFTFGALQFLLFSSFLHFLRFLLSASRYRFMIHWGLCGRWCNITLCRWAGGVHALEESSQDLISKVFCLFCLLCSNLPNFWHNVAGGHDWCPRRAG